MMYACLVSQLQRLPFHHLTAKEATREFSFAFDGRVVV